MIGEVSVPVRALVLTALLAGCGPGGSNGSGAPAPRRPDGERGHGRFETAWGVEDIDYVWRNGRRVYEGDLVLAEDAEEMAPPAAGRAPLLSSAYLRWEMGASGVVVIPYEIQNTGGLDATAYERTEGRILRAMEHWESYVRRPGGGELLRFVPHAPGSGGRFVVFEVKHNGGVCYVNLNADGRSRVDSDPACRWQTYVHEVGHVLTFRHEQKRLDRPEHVLFHADRTTEDREFEMVSGNTLDTTYDSRSIMHYPSCMFATARCTPSASGAWVLERLAGARYIEWWSERTVAEVLSPTDVCGTRTLYGVACGGGTTVVEDAGMPEMDAGAPGDAGIAMPDAGAGGADAGVPMPGIAFPVSIGVAGMLQRVSTGECAAPLAGGIGVGLANCDELEPAHRWGLAPTEALRNEGSARCAEPNGDLDGAGVEQRDCVPGDAQRWRLGDMELVNGSAGTCVAVPGSDYFAGQHLVHRLCGGGANQQFTYDPATHEILAQGWCLTASDTVGGRIELHECDGSPLQRWIETNGGFAAGGLCMHVRGGAGSAPGAVVDVTDCNAMVGQMWGLRGHIAYFDDELCLSPAGAGAPLELAECSASEAMIWWPRGACVPLACADLGASCGSFDDGCGAALECGECASVPEDRDGGPGEREECIPLACADLGTAPCGTKSDGCGGVVDCGPCRTGGGCSCRAAGAASDGWGATGWAAVALAAWTWRRRRRAPRA